MTRKEKYWAAAVLLRVNETTHRRLAKGKEKVKILLDANPDLRMFVQGSGAEGIHGGDLHYFG